MVAPARIRPCAPEELPALVALLDAEFVFGKGRSISLARRFPALLGAANCRNVLVASRGEGIDACIAVKRFDWIAPGRSWRGAMIGLVYTRPAERGQGLATQLLRAAQEQLRAGGTAFAVLFTAQPAFYRRLGWIGADRGVFGTCSAPAGSGAGGADTGCTPADAQAIEAMRTNAREARMARDETAYRALPLPAERLEKRASIGSAAYAIYGVRADDAYVYEFGGEASGYALLWQDICAGARRIHVNARRGSAAQRWLANLPGIAWREQALAMWLPLAEPASAAHFSEWYVPYLDRI